MEELIQLKGNLGISGMGFAWMFTDQHFDPADRQHSSTHVISSEVVERKS